MSAAAVARRDRAPTPSIERIVQQESAAAATFESRWTMRALKRVDADLCQAVDEQRQLYHEARLIGNEQQIIEHGEAMCRGWAASVKRMEQEQEPDDSYILGQSGGIMVAIGVQQSASARVRELHGDRVVWLTPDEVAAMFAGMQTVATVKALWPGAEIMRVERYSDEPAQEDA